MKESHAEDRNDPSNEGNDHNPHNHRHPFSTDGRKNLPSDNATNSAIADQDANVKDRCQLRRPISHGISADNLD